MLISEDYRDLNAKLHKNQPAYGVTGKMKGGRPVVNTEIIGMVKAAALRFGAKSILDYGCGKGMVGHLIGGEFDVAGYDPAIPGKEGPPEPADLVCCLDVLEHIEPECLVSVLDHIKALARKAVVLEIAMLPAKKVLADGRNAHLIVENQKFWVPLIGSRWKLKDARASKTKISFMGLV